MGNIFDEEKLYPYEGAIKEHFEDHYDSVFIALLPFFQLDREETDKSNLKKAKLLSHEEALKEIDDYYLYSADKEILFTIEWDSFFFLIATDRKKMDKLIASRLLEGFLCNDKTDHYWEYTVE